MVSTMTMASNKTRFTSFEQDKNNVISGIESYINGNGIEPNDPAIHSVVKKMLAIGPNEVYWRVLKDRPVVAINKLLSKENLVSLDYHELARNLEILKDIKSHIFHHYDEKNNLLIRDARFAAPNDSKKADTSIYLANLANYTQAAKDVFEIEIRSQNLSDKEINDKIQTFNKSLDDDFKILANQLFKGQEFEEMPEKDIKKFTDNKIFGIVSKLEEQGIAESRKKLVIARDFQNFNHKQYNFATISRVQGKDYVEAEVGLRNMTAKQKGLYEGIDLNPSQNTNPDWYKANDDFTKGIIFKYKDTITGGQHILPTQTRGIVGLRNAAEAITARIENGSLNILLTSKHTATVATNLKDKAAQSQITSSNIEQAQEWIGKDKRLHINSLNSPNNIF